MCIVGGAVVLLENPTDVNETTHIFDDKEILSNISAPGAAWHGAHAVWERRVLSRNVKAATFVASI